MSIAARSRLNESLRKVAQAAEKELRSEDRGGSSAHRLMGDRTIQFLDDEKWRSKVLGLGPRPYEKMARLMEAYGADAVDEDGVPVENIVQPAALELAAYGVQNFPDAMISAQCDLSGFTEDELRVIHEAKRETESRINALVDWRLVQSNYDDLKEGLIRQATYFGAGICGLYLDRSLSDASREVNRLLKQDHLTESEFERLDRLAKQVRLALWDAEGVVWQRGVKRVFDRGSVHGTKMLRMSYHEVVDTDSARARYGRDDITAGRDRFGLGSRHSTAMAVDNQTGLVTTWEINEEAAERVWEDKIVSGPAGVFKRKVAPYTSRVMVRTVIAGDKLVDVEVWDSLEGLVELPGVPVYMRESQQHPYGLCIPLLYEQKQAFRNRIRNLIYKIALKSFTGQGGLIDGRHLPANVDKEAIIEALQTGNWEVVDFGEDVDRNFSLKDLFYSGSAVVDGIAPALMQAYQMDIADSARTSEMVDIKDLASARTGQAKAQHIAYKDRPKTITLGHLSEAAEEIIERMTLWEVALLDGTENHRISVDGANGGYVTMNESVTVDVPRVDGAGNPIQVDEETMSTFEMAGMPLDEVGVGEDGTLRKPFTVIYGDTSMEFKARAETRSSLPQNMADRMIFLDFMAENERYITVETARELALEGDIKALDDRIREDQAQRMMEQQMMEEQMMAEQAAAQQVMVDPAEAVAGGDAPVSDPGLGDMLPPEIRRMSPDQVSAENAQLEQQLRRALSRAL